MGDWRGDEVGAKVGEYGSSVIFLFLFFLVALRIEMERKQSSCCFFRCTVVLG